MKRITVLLIILLGLLTACRPEAKPLKYVIIPAEDAARSEEQFTPFIEYLSQAIEQEVELMLVADYTAVVEAMKYGHADVARFGPFSYVLATQEADVEAVAVAVKEKTGTPSYKSIIISTADIEDLNGKTFAYVDVASTSGYLAPATYFRRGGVELGEVFFAGSHGAVIEAVKNGTVDAGAIADNRYLTAIQEGVIAEGELHIVWESDPIPNSPVAVQKSMDGRLKERLVRALLNAPQDLVYSTGIGEIGFVKARDNDYDVVREMQKAKESLAGD